MYPTVQAGKNPNKIAFVMASTGETVTYGELEARTNRLAHLLRANGLNRFDHYAIFMRIIRAASRLAVVAKEQGCTTPVSILT